MKATRIEEIVANTIQEVLREQKAPAASEKATEKTFPADGDALAGNAGAFLLGTAQGRTDGGPTAQASAAGAAPKMTLRLATALIDRLEREARRRRMRIVAAVSDAAGRPVAIHCMDGAYIGSFDVALNKTYTSVAFQMSTEALGKLAQPGQPLYGVQFTNGGKIVIFGGGEPLFAGETMIGALGVSGGTAEQDTALAAYGKSILKEVFTCL